MSINSPIKFNRPIQFASLLLFLLLLSLMHHYFDILNDTKRAVVYYYFVCLLCFDCSLFFIFVSCKWVWLSIKLLTEFWTFFSIFFYSLIFSPLSFQYDPFHKKVKAITKTENFKTTGTFHAEWCRISFLCKKNQNFIYAFVMNIPSTFRHNQLIQI